MRPLPSVPVSVWRSLAAGLWVAAPANGCPVCHTETGEQVRAAIFGSDFLVNLAMAVAPFPVLVAFVGWIYFRFPIGAGGPCKTEDSCLSRFK